MLVSAHCCEELGSRIFVCETRGPGPSASLLVSGVMAYRYTGLGLAHWLAEYDPRLSQCYRALVVSVFILTCKGPDACSRLLVSVLGLDTGGCSASIVIGHLSAH